MSTRAVPTSRSGSPRGPAKVTVFSASVNAARYAHRLHAPAVGHDARRQRPDSSPPQVPDGISLDTKRGRLVVSNSRTSGITVVGMKATTTSSGELIAIANTHPMGSVVDTAAGRAYVALNNAARVAVVNTVTGRKISEIGASAVIVRRPRRQAAPSVRGHADYLTKDDATSPFDNSAPTRSSSASRHRRTRDPRVRPGHRPRVRRGFDTGRSMIDPDSLTIVKTVQTHSSPNKLAIDAQRRLVYTADLRSGPSPFSTRTPRRPSPPMPTNAPVHHAVDPRTGAVCGTQHQSGRLAILSVARATDSPTLFAPGDNETDSP